ncbi:MAG: GMC family oxidoreductase [Pseudomonadota bacterium]|nr:GMC family oxidoreductase [Pseudomonadota bacterium]
MSVWKPGDGVLLTGPAPAEGYSTADRDLECDVVIVGTGPGGASVARVLAAAGARVILLEEGPPESRFAKNQGDVMRYHMQEGGAMVAAGNAYMPIASGRGVGGGTLVNSAMAWRAPDYVLDDWVTRLGDERYGPKALAPLFDQLTELLGVWPTRPEIAGKNNDLIVRGVRALGLEGGYVPRATPGCVGCGVCYFGCPSGGKASMNLNLLVEATRSGARIVADTKVDTVLVEGDRVVGVSGRMSHPDSRAPGGRVTVRAGRTVIAAGGIGTPRLLHHAGLAKRLGPAVGKGLHVHPGNAVLGICDEPVEMWKGATQGAYFHVDELPGVLPHTFSAPPEVCLGMMAPPGPEMKKAIDLLPYLCGLIVMVSDTGEGTVGAHADGRADIRYDFADIDLERTKQGMYWAAKVLLAGGARELFAPVHGVTRTNSAEDLRDQLSRRTIADFTLYAAHPMSTCRMGLDPATSVIRPDGRSHALEGLYLADSSVFPTSLGVNPSLTTMAVATAIAAGMVGGG